MAELDNHRRIWWPNWRQLVAIIALLAIGAATPLVLMDIELCPPCPPDHWPHHAHTASGDPCDLLLYQIQQNAVAALKTATAAEALDIERAIRLAFQCAWQDGLAPSSLHNESVWRAYGYSLPATVDWKKCADELSGVDHPH